MAKENNKSKSSKKSATKKNESCRGLACADQKTRERVARMGGKASSSGGRKAKNKTSAWSFWD